MPTPDIWQKSSYSGSGDGNNCIEIACSPARISIRDSKVPTHAPLSFPHSAFISFLQTLKTAPQGNRA
ncbi:DUF397 domain-containing protein [Streptomyces sp. 15-116A]|uniref:DUF397 domain-containing protein n=1 Tax=Streptomyces sp. 15-116A TaxID=2259035 RepID=UPI0021B3DA1D|nr:DUF397 domain-containing protein [Streptomyces sp. 15-116A]MCT7352078.1 DUF397 domain-containing protein [Streptomyces sp. 15-116A]